MIEGLNEEPREVAIGTSILLGGYMLTLRRHRGDPDRVQLLLTQGRKLITTSYISCDELQAVVNPVITGRKL